MSEPFPSAESEKGISREDVIGAYRKFVERGISNPDNLDLNDPEVREANELFDKWRAQEDARSEGNEEAGHRVNLSKTMLYVDAGFVDPGYLKEVLGEWLIQDAQNAEKQPDNPERVETRRQITAAIKKIRGILERPQQ